MAFKLPSKILIATGNKGKFSEISDLLKTINIESVATFDFDIEEPEETGTTFAQNSLLKAKYYAQKTNLPALADDSGICIDDLDGRPGIYAARFAKNEQGKTDFVNTFAKIKKELEEKNVDLSNKPKAHFICNLSLFDPQTNFEMSFEGRVDGHLVFPARGDKGFGYDPIFIKDGMDKTFGEIEPELKDKISHRGDAFNKLLKALVKD